MFKKIKKNKKIGSFEDFQWEPNLPDFERFNCIFGWNGSGKTTLSRIFQSLETGESSNLGSDFEFEFQDEGDSLNTITFTSSLKPIIKTFNSDFINKNLKWSESDITPLLIVGEENIQLETELQGLENSLKELTKTKEDYKISKESDKKIIDNELTRVAREIKINVPRQTSFNKTSLEQEIDKFRQKYQSASDLLLSDERYSQILKQAQPIECKKTSTNVDINYEEFEVIEKNAHGILSRKLVSEETLPQLNSSDKLSTWVAQGIKLHDGKTVCEFCASELTTERINNLNKHFSDKYETFISDINSLIEKLKAIKVDIRLHDEANIYPELTDEYQLNEKELGKHLSNYNKYIDTLIKDIKQKQSKPFAEYYPTKAKFNLSVLKSKLDNYNDLVYRNNEITNDFSNKQQDAISKIIDHHIASYLLNEKISKSNENFSKSQESLVATESSIENLEAEINKVKKQISETTKGAEHINHFVSKYFNKYEIKIQIQDNKFMLMRDDNIAKNLSEGEKTAIAFAYFIASLDGNGNNLSETIVFIDDPISSLDSNYLFNTYSFIKDKFYDYSDKKHKCKQLFISTHNSDFFNLIKEWFNKMRKYCSYYLVEKRKLNSNKQGSSKLISMPDSLINIKSDYLYLFSIIMDFDKNPSLNHCQLLNLPNILRRFLENYLAFKFLEYSNIDSSIELLISDNVEKERVRKYVHYYSHNLRTNSMLNLTDLNELCDVIKIVLNAIKLNDKTHFEALIKKLSPKDKG